MKFVVLLMLVGLAASQNHFFQNRGFGNFRGGRGRDNRFSQGPSFFKNSGRSSSNRGRSSSNSGGNSHDSDGVNEYHYSSRVGQSNLRGDEVHGYCSKLGRGWAPVSIESSSKNSYIQRVINGEHIKYIWTGGRRSGRSFTWPTGGKVGSRFQDWSHTGGNGVPQPDNRDRPEDCLAVLKNVYRDGIKWHDVNCSHRKPTVCERRL